MPPLQIYSAMFVLLVLQRICPMDILSTSPQPAPIKAPSLLLDELAPRPNQAQAAIDPGHAMPGASGGSNTGRCIFEPMQAGGSARSNECEQFMGAFVLWVWLETYEGCFSVE